MLQTYHMHLISKLFPRVSIAHIYLINYLTVAIGKYSIIVSRSIASDCPLKIDNLN